MITCLTYENGLIWRSSCKAQGRHTWMSCTQNSIALRLLVSPLDSLLPRFRWTNNAWRGTLSTSVSLTWLSEQPTQRICSCGFGSEGIKSAGTGTVIYRTFARKDFIFKAWIKNLQLWGYFSIYHLGKPKVNANMWLDFYVKWITLSDHISHHCETHR
jgi:hypothetical protein